MRLKRVEITGFKSFMERTCLHIEPGVTAIVGPNGCGKSNIVDAIRWAMGEASAKALRGQAMEDVIFHGTDSDKPVGMAEVTLTFENTNGHAPQHLAGCSEIEVTRRLFRSGESEYCINRVPCRRRDILELFMDTGLGNRSYAIVEQDRVSRIISAKSEERRVVVEEVAGISRYRSRREAAQRKIEATRQNLQRIQDIRHEVAQQIQALERQAKKAERYRALKTRLLELERELVLSRWAVLEKERVALQERIGAVGDQKNEMASALESQELAIEKGRITLLELERRVLEGQEDLHRKERALRDLENAVQRQTQELQTLEVSERSLEEELEELRAKSCSANEQLQSLRGKNQQVTSELHQGRASLEELSRQLQQGMEKARLLRARLEEARVELVEWMAERARLRNATQNHRRRSEELERILGKEIQEGAELRKRLEGLASGISTMEGQLAQLEGSLGELRIQRETLQGELTRLATRREEIRARCQKLLAGIQEIRSRIRALESLQGELAGFSEGVRALREAAQGGRLSLGQGVPRAVAEVMDVPPGAERMVAGLLGERLQYLIVGSWKEALQGLAFVRDKGLGRVGFVAISEDATKEQRVTEVRGDSLPVQWDPGYEALGDILLEGTQLVEDLGHALTSSPGHGATRFVTVEGDVLDTKGILETGQRRDPSQGFLARKRELRELGERLGPMEEQHERARQEEAAISRMISELSSQASALLEQLHGRQLRIAECRRDLLAAKEAQGLFQQRLEALEWQIRERKQELESLHRTQGEDIGKLENLDSRILQREKELQGMEQESREASRKLDELRSRLTNVRVHVASLQERSQSLAREIQGLEKLLAELQKDSSRKQAQRALGRQRSQQIKEFLRSSGGQLQALMSEYETARAKLEDSRRGLQHLRSELQEKERAVQDKRNRMRLLEGELQELGLRHHEISLRMEHAMGELQGRLEMDAQAVPLAAAGLDAIDPDAQQERIMELREALDKLGEVNLMAQEQYNSLKERYDALTAQQEDLETSIRSLQKAIQRIDRTSRRRFKEAFERLDAEFRRVFPILFEGGEGYLMLTQAEDVLDAGVEIVARPPGKRLQSISLLSGGEKALAAVALIFAMIMIKETPFCLFDEVDAPLDEANIDRFNRMVRELSKKSQFILVTHSKRTMEMADVLHGVTMESPGISKMISVRLQ